MGHEINETNVYQNKLLNPSLIVNDSHVSLPLPKSTQHAFKLDHFVTNIAYSNHDANSFSKNHNKSVVQTGRDEKTNSTVFTSRMFRSKINTIQ